MTVSSENNRNTYNGNGATTVFAYTFKILAQGDILVQWKVESTDVITTKTITTHYTVSGVGESSGGNVTFTAGNEPPTGTTVILTRDMAATQLVDYTEYDAFPAETHETALDRLTMLHLQQQLLVDQSLKLDNSITGLDTTIVAAEADQYLKVNTDGDGFEFVDLADVDAIELPVSVAHGGTGSTTAADARTALGLAIGTDVQAYDAELAALASTTSAADKVPYFTGSGTATTMTVTTAARTVLDDTTTGAMLTTLGAQPLDGELTALAGLTSAANKVPMFTGSGTATVIDVTAAAITVLDDTTVSAMIDTLGGASAQGSGGIVRETSPTLTTPNIGVATGTSFNGLTGAATQAEQETGTSTTTVVTPGRQKFNPCSAKAWAYFDGTGTSVFSSFNIASNTDSGTGDHNLNFTVALSGNNCSTASGNGVTARILNVAAADQTTHVRVLSFDAAGVAADVDGMVQVFGDQ